MINEIGIKVTAITNDAKLKVNEFASYVKQRLGQSSEVKIGTKESVSNLKKLEDKIEDINGDIRKNKAETALLNRELKNFNKNTKDNAANIAETTRKIGVHNDQLTSYNKKLRDTKRATADLKKSGLSNYFKDLSNNLGTTLKRIAAFTLAFAAIRGTKALFSNSIANSIEFESALTGVNKTMDLSSQELQSMDNNFKQLSKTIPLTYVELAKIAEIGGQLAVPKEEIIEFTQVMAELKATTNLTTDDAILNFAKFNNVLGVSGDEIRKVGNSIVHLGNNSATTESQILTFAKRIAATGKVSGFTSHDILAIGAAFSSAGIEAEAGGTAVNKTMARIGTAVRKGGEELELFATLSGKTSKEFAKERKSDAASAFSDFLNGLRLSGAEAEESLEKLGLENVRTVRALLSTANSTLDLRKAIDIMNEGLEDNNALQAEAEKRFDTTESKLKIQASRWRIIGDYLGDELKPILLSVGDLLLDLAGKTSKLFSDMTAGLKLIGTDLGFGTKIVEKRQEISRLLRKQSQSDDVEERKRISKQIEDNVRVLKILERQKNGELDIIVDANEKKQQILSTDTSIEKLKSDEVTEIKDAASEEIKILQEKLKDLDEKNKANDKKRIREVEKALEKERIEIKRDADKRYSIISKYNTKVAITTENTTKKESERILRIKKGALKRLLGELKYYSGEELDAKEKQAGILNDLIEENTKNIERHSEIQAEHAEKFGDALVDGIKDAKDEIDDLDDKIKKIQNIGQDEDEALAERRVELLEEQRDIEEDIAKFKASQVSSANQYSLETLKSIGEGDIGSNDVGDLIEIKEKLQEQKDLEEELKDNIKLGNEAVYDKISAYEELNESEKIHQDSLEDEKELLEELGGEYETLDEALDGLTEKRKNATDEHQKLMELQIEWEQFYGQSVADEFIGIKIVRDAEIAQLDKVISRLKERNALMGNEASNVNITPTSTETQESPTIINNIDNSNYNISESDNARTTAKNINKGDRLESRGATPSNNS